MRVNEWLNQPQPEEVLTPEVEEEFTLLMSLALDQLLDEAEQQQLQRYVERYPTLAAEWQRWQLLDRCFSLAPAAEPLTGFVERFEGRLAQQERRSVVWRNWLIASLIILVWGGLLVGGVTLAAYVMLFQGSWLGEFIHMVAYGSTTVMNWVGTALNTLGALATTPQAISFCVGYLVAAATLLFFWVRFLRRTTAEIEWA